jgi:hypothetical protein
MLSILLAGAMLTQGEMCFAEVQIIIKEKPTEVGL